MIVTELQVQLSSNARPRPLQNQERQRLYAHPTGEPNVAVKFRLNFCRMIYGIG